MQKKMKEDRRKSLILRNTKSQLDECNGKIEKLNEEKYETNKVKILVLQLFAQNDFLTIKISEKNSSLENKINYNKNHNLFTYKKIEFFILLHT